MDSPDAATPEWLKAGFSASDARTFINAGVPLDIARQWTDAGIEPDDAIDYIDKTVPLVQATEFAESGIEPHQITRTDTGYEVELEPWQEDPVDQLPALIEPGRFGMSLWSFAPWNGEVVYTGGLGRV